MRSMPHRSVVDGMIPARSPLVGRKDELQLIWSQYRIAMNGNARVVLLAGELGIGKTRLLDEIADRALPEGATVLQGEASDSEGMPAYLPFLIALGRYIRAIPLDRLREQVSVAPQILASILPEISGRLGELPATYSLPQEQKRFRLYEAIGSFLEAISTSRPLLLTLDDLQWADSASLNLLCHIIRYQPEAKLLVVGSYREGEVSRNTALDHAIIELGRQRVLTRVKIDPLSEDEIEELAVNYLKGPISSSVKQVLYAQSEGNPFFAEEILAVWSQKGDLVQEGELWLPASQLEHTLPSSIVGALREQLMRLSPITIDHLRVAAAIGRTFELSLLAAVEAQEVEEVEDHLLEAVNAHLIRTVEPGVYMFEHSKIRETLNTEVSTSRRRRLHEAIGLVLESLYALKKTGSIYELSELAFHFTQSRDRERGVSYAQQAAEQALQAFALKEAKDFYQTALDLIDASDSRRGRLLLGLGRAALLDRMENDAVAAYQAALSWSLQSGELETAAQAARGVGLAYWRQGALLETRKALEHAMELLKNSSSPLAVQVLVDLATLLIVYLGEQDAGATYIQQAREMADRLGDNLLQAAVSRVVARKDFVPVNNLLLTVQSMERAMVIIEAHDDACEAAECSLYLASLYYWMAEIKRSHEISLRWLEFNARCRQQCQSRDVFAWLALLHASQGRWADAEQAIEQTKSVAINMAHPASVNFLHQIRGFLAYQREDYVTAERELRASDREQQRGFQYFMFHTGLPGLVMMASGKHEEVNAYITEQEALLDKLPADTLTTAPIMMCLALLAIVAGNRERLIKLYPRLLRFKGQHYWFLVDRILGMICIATGDWDMAMSHLADAEAVARREDLVPELARTLLAQADCELARNAHACERGRELLEHALALFKRLGLTAATTDVSNRLRTLSSQPQSPPQAPLPARLTKSEVKVLQLVAQGKSNRQIARELSLSEKTVANHITHIFNKTGCENRVAATTFAIRSGLISESA